MDDFEMPYPQYRCPTCGKDLPLNEARMTVACGEHREVHDIEFVVREATVADRHHVEEICDRALGETELDIFGKTFDILAGTNLIAEADGRFAGLLSVTVDGGDAVILLLSVYPDFHGQSAGSTLLDAAADLAAQRGLQALRAAVSNDDIPLLYFYQRHQFAIYDIAVGLVADQLGSVVAGFSGIPVRDEIRMRRPVCR
ncbi:MAG: GNAT family N-acetyltransferase [Actinomycetota bacterium]|nr:GNAT family N-acetyltransferase [Actinomycetota bacterium]